MIGEDRRRFWNARPVLVTGASGLMGGWTTKSLLAAGADVVILLRDRVPGSMLVWEGILDRCTVVHGQLEDAHILRRACSDYSIDTIFHLAAQPLVGVAKLDPVSTLQANVLGTWNILEAARQTQVKQVVVASSDKAYGSSNNLPYLETHPLQGEYPYDVSKSCADLISSMYAKTYGLRVGIARCANLFGGGDLNFSRTVPGVIKSTFAGERFQIRSDGKFVRDFLYVKDGANAYLTLAEKLASGAAVPGDAFNFSLELRLSVIELVDMVLNAMGRADLRPEILNRASAEIREQYLSCEKARTVLGWAPEYTISRALRETIDWYESHFTALKANQTAVPAAASR
jgi:CDP-glucose 4,6-dehydratase